MSNQVTIYHIEEKPEAYELIGQHLWEAFTDLYKDWGFDGPEAIANWWKRAQNNELPALFVAYLDDNETLIGCVAAVLDDMPGLETNCSPWLSVLYVVDEYRKQGVATKLMSHCKEYVKSLGYDECYLWSEKPQWEAVYSKLGWNTVKRVDYLCYKDAPIMRFLLTQK
jgi:GNAT superfamily N-acetyltransferase